MDILSDDKPNAEKAAVHLNKLKSGSIGVVSSVLFSELAFHIRRKKSKERVEEILIYVSSLPNLEVMDVTPEIAKMAGLLRAHYAGKIEKKLTYFDCVHLATAISAGCDKFMTGDKGFKDIREIKMEIY